MQDLTNKLVAWIKEGVAAAHCQGVAVGLSGGVDSSAVAVLCKKAFPQDVLGVIMPCHSDEKDLALAQAVADKFEIPTRTIILDSAYDSLLRTLTSDDFDRTTKRMAEANLKPRLRMIVLYYLANRLNYLVAGTGNRSELAVGYSTKYGDGGVDILPLGNLVKTKVWELAAYLGIPQEIVDRPPTAGLWAGQTDEGEMGLTYKELDRYLTTGQAEETIRKRVDAMAAASAHKRQMPPIPPF
jgi:NAD+ synthase